MKQYRSYNLKSLFSNTIICISISLFSCNSPKIRVSGNDFNQRDIDTVSIVSVLDNPGNYHQKKLAIEGGSSFGFEMSGIFIDEASRRNLTFENAVWLIPTPTISNAQIDSIEKFFNNKLLRVIRTLEVIYFEQL